MPLRGARLKLTTTPRVNPRLVKNVPGKGRRGRRVGDPPQNEWEYLNRLNRDDFMRTMNEIMDKLNDFIELKAPHGVHSEDELQQIIEEFMMQHKEAVQHLQDFLQENGQDDTVPADIYDYLDLAEQASRKKDKREYLAKAAELEPDNVEVKLAQAELDSKGPLDMLKVLPDLISAEEKRLKDQEIYQRSKGDFWLDFETRPYMMLLQEYLSNLIECGIHNKAIQVGEEMMRLNKNDNLGIRFQLMPLYAKMCNEMKALKLYKQGADEQKSSFYLLALALLYFKLGDWPKAKSYLETLKQEYPITKKLIRSIKKGDQSIFQPYLDNPPYAPFSDEELITAYLTNYAIYATEPYFFDWADEALIVHRKKKK